MSDFPASSASSASSSPSWIGVDVSKDSLDAHVRPANLHRRFGNSPEGIAQLVAWVKAHGPATQRVVFESTGSYQKAAVGALLAEGLPAVVVNARQVRDFAKGHGKLAKTDVIDAAILAHFGQDVATIVRPLESREILEFRQLYDRRLQLVHLLVIEKNRLHAAQVGMVDSRKVRKTIDGLIAFLERQIADLEKRMDEIVESSETFRARNEILRSIVGFGPQVSRTLLVQLPELGQRTRQGISALVGVAPYPEQSGKKDAPRHIRGGRSKVRVALYQAAITAIRCCPQMKAFYHRLKARGKASKVAIVAVARKLLVLANALLRTMTPYRAPANSV
jgi:transposase